MQQDQGSRVGGRQGHRPQRCVPVVGSRGDRSPQKTRCQCKGLFKITGFEERQSGLRVAALDGVDRPGQPGRIGQRRLTQEFGRNPDDGTEVTGHQPGTEGIKPDPGLFRNQALTLRQQVRALGIVAAEAGQQTGQVKTVCGLPRRIDGHRCPDRGNGGCGGFDRSGHSRFHRDDGRRPVLRQDGRGQRRQGADGQQQGEAEVTHDGEPSRFMRRRQGLSPGAGHIFG
jgi:hypothetical protein